MHIQKKDENKEKILDTNQRRQKIMPLHGAFLILPPVPQGADLEDPFLSRTTPIQAAVTSYSFPADDDRIFALYPGTKPS